MPIELKMPALSPTMEEGTLAKWLVKEGDDVKSGDILAEIETDKATMEFEAVDEGKIAKILVPEGTDGVKVGAPIAIIAGEGESVDVARGAESRHRRRLRRRRRRPSPRPTQLRKRPAAPGSGRNAGRSAAARRRAARRRASGSRPRRSRASLAQAQGIDLKTLQGSGPGGRIVRADLGKAAGGAAAAPAGRCSRQPLGHAPRHSGAVRARNPARGDQAVQRPQDHRAAPDRVRSSRSRTSI